MHCHEQSPLQIGTASFPYNESYHSNDPSAFSSTGGSTYHFKQMEQVSCHLYLSSACRALSRKYSGNSYALSISARIKLCANVRDANSTRDVIIGVLSGRLGR